MKDWKPVPLLLAELFVIGYNTISVSCTEGRIKKSIRKGIYSLDSLVLQQVNMVPLIDKITTLFILPKTIFMVANDTVI